MEEISHERLRKSLAKSMTKVHSTKTGPEGRHTNEVWSNKETGLMVIATYSPLSGEASGRVALSKETFEFLAQGTEMDEPNESDVEAIIPYDDFHFEGEETSVTEREPKVGDVIVAKDENGKEFRVKMVP